MPIDLLPTAPSTADPSTFNTRADAMVAAFNPMITQINSSNAQASLDALTAQGAAASALAVGAGGLSTSSTSLSVGTGSKSLTVQTGKSYVPGLSLTIARTSAASTIYMRGIVDSYNSGTGALVVNVSLASGSGTFTDWTLSLTTAGAPGAVSEQYVARSANVQLKAADSGSWIDLTAGGFTQTFDAPNALGTSWRIRIRNSSNSEIIIPASDGITNWKMYPQEVRDFNCDGQTIRSVPIKAFYKVFSSADNFIWPPGYAQVIADLQGAGGGGSAQGGNSGTANSNALGGMGGAGGARVIIPVNSPGAGQITLVTVGLGGTGAQTTAQSGTAGTNTSFGELIAFGGAGGIFSSTVARGGFGISQDTWNGTAFGVTGVGYFPANGVYNGQGNPGHGGCAEWAGANSGVAGNASSVPQGGSSLFGGGAGGSGGGLASNVSVPGGNGGGTLSKVPGTGGTGGTATAGTQGQGGNGANGSNKRLGGGGGGSTNSGSLAGGNGGNGGIGAGGGGGGASTGGAAGKGGNGGNGELILSGQI